MKKQFSEEKVVEILQAAQGGTTIREVCRHYGISENTYYVWKKKYGDMEGYHKSRVKNTRK